MIHNIIEFKGSSYEAAKTDLKGSCRGCAFYAPKVGHFSCINPDNAPCVSGEREDEQSVIYKLVKDETK